MELSVVIVSYNVRYFLEQCLFSVIKASEGLKTEIYVVDNHSSDDSVEYLSAVFPDVHFIPNAVNEGFSKANNKVLPLLKGDFVLFLNPDTVVPEDCFQKCISFLRHQKNCGALGLRMINGSGKFLPESKRSAPGLMSSFFKLTGLQRLFSRSTFFSSYYAANVGEHETGPVGVLSGAFMMLPRGVLNRVGGFDPDFFMYGEDVDLSCRILREGFNNYYLGSCTIIHFKGESGSKKSKRQINHFYGAMSLFVSKYYAAPMKWILKSGISIRKAFALIGLSLMKSNNEGSNGRLLRNLIFIGAEEEFTYANQMVQAASPEINLIRSDDEISLSMNPDDLEKILNKSGAQAVFFCEGKLSFASIIEAVGRYGNSADIMIHAKGSRSLVGTDGAVGL